MRNEAWKQTLKKRGIKGNIGYDISYFGELKESRYSWKIFKSSFKFIWWLTRCKIVHRYQKQNEYKKEIITNFHWFYIDTKINTNNQKVVGRLNFTCETSGIILTAKRQYWCMWYCQKNNFNLFPLSSFLLLWFCNIYKGMPKSFMLNLPLFVSILWNRGRFDIVCILFKTFRTK